jgi:hypothetical protein
MTSGSMLVVLSLLAQPALPPPDQTPPARQIGSRTQSDQTVTIPKGARLVLDDCAGEVVVRTWDRDAVRVEAQHTSRTRVRVDLQGTALRIDTDSDRGRGIADFTLTVPTWLNLRIDGQSCFVEVAGVAGTVSVETVEGDISLRGLTGAVDAKSIEGTILVEGGRGRLQISTVEGDITIAKASGEIIAESIDGDVVLTDVQASAVEIATVDGDITYGGALQPAGRYLFTTHDGDVALMVPENTSATFAVRTFNDGSLTSSLPLKQGAAGRRGQRTIHTLGGGAAQVDIEAFDGSVRIGRPGETKRD